MACREAGVGVSFINDIERGQTPSVARVQLLAQYLGCTVSDLLGEEAPPDPVRQEFMRLLDSMTAEQRNELFAFMLRLKRERGKIRRCPIRTVSQRISPLMIFSAAARTSACAASSNCRTTPTSPPPTHSCRAPSK